METLWPLLELLPDAVFVVDRATRIVVAANGLACAGAGLSREELCGRALDQLCRAEDAAALARRMESAGDEELPAVMQTTFVTVREPGAAAEWRISRWRYEDKEYWIIASRETASPFHSQTIGLGLPGHDPLTGLADRRLFERRMARAIDDARRKEGFLFAVGFIDLDGFKAVNDRFGHLIGDRALCEAARRLASSVRPADMAARFGGDEFTVFLDDLREMSNAVAIARRILERLQAPFDIDGNEIHLSASIGIAAGNADCRSIEDILRQADRAMYRAKSHGGGQIAEEQAF